MSDNYTKVQQAFRILHPQLAGYVCQELRREYQDNWWQEPSPTRPATCRTTTAITLP